MTCHDAAVLLFFAFALGCARSADGLVPTAASGRDPVTVGFRSEARASSGSTLLTVTILNSGAAPVWVVADPWFTWREADGAAELSLTRERMHGDAQVFGYFDPEVHELAPGQTWDREVELRWPLRLSRLWNDQDEVSLSAGTHPLRVRVGYGRVASPAPIAGSTSVEEPVLQWQQTALSPVGELRVP